MIRSVAAYSVWRLAIIVNPSAFGIRHSSFGIVKPPKTIQLSISGVFAGETPASPTAFGIRHSAFGIVKPPKTIADCRLPVEQQIVLIAKRFILLKTESCSFDSRRLFGVPAVIAWAFPSDAAVAEIVGGGEPSERREIDNRVG